MTEPRKSGDPMRLGIDVGGVICDGDIALPGALGGLTLLASDDRRTINIVSKCGEATEARTRAWLHEEQVDLWIPEERWHFCRERSDKSKIAEALKLTHFVDNRLEILVGMQRVVPELILFRGWTEEVIPHFSRIDWKSSRLVEAGSWRSLLMELGLPMSAWRHLPGDLARPVLFPLLSSVKSSSEVRRPVADFTQLMELVLKANDDKGGWGYEDAKYLLDRLDEECKELRKAAKGAAGIPVSESDVAREAADVANFAMMIADVFGNVERATMEERSRNGGCRVTAFGPVPNPVPNPVQTKRSE